MKELWVFAVGGLAQLLFSARMLIQWIKTEKAGKVQSPLIFWQMSIIASLLLMIYGVLRNDAVIIAGQLLAYFVYIRNRQLQNNWKKINVVIRQLAYLIPVAVFIWIFSGNTHNWNAIIHNRDISGWVLFLGSAGQVLFATRFLFQWYWSERKQESIFPPVFWIVSITGAGLILLYGVFRQDPILILGQFTGMIMYVRNLQLHYSFSRFNSIEHDHA